MKTVVITASEDLVISLELAKLHCRLATDDSSEDALIEQLICVSTERAEHQLGRSLLTKTYRTMSDDVSKLNLLPTLQEVASVVLLDEDGEETTLDEADYAVRDSALIPSVVLKVAAQKTMIVNYDAGYGGAEAVPKSIKQWILVDLATLYENREAIIVGTINSGIPYPFVDGLLDPYRVQY